MNDAFGELLYVGTTCSIGGFYGTLTAIRYENGYVVGCYVHLWSGAMVRVDLANAIDGIREVTAWRFIDRDEFDRLEGIDDSRQAAGWRSGAKPGWWSPHEERDAIAERRGS